MSIRRTLAHRAAARLQQLHADERGAISVLVLLTIWCLVAVLGMLWNTTEQARQRQILQTGADAAAQSAATWMARSVNEVTAQNLILCQDMSAETLARAVGPTYTKAKAKLDAEVALIARLRAANPLIPVGRNLVGERARIAAEYELADRALRQIFVFRVDDQYFADQKEKDRFKTESDAARQALDAANAIMTNEIDPLLAKIQNSQLTQVNDAILDEILRVLQTTEIPLIEGFRSRTQPADSAAVISHLEGHRAQLFGDEQKVVQGVPAAVEETRKQLEKYYGTELTLATLRTDDGGAFSNGAGSDPSQVRAPLQPAGMIEAQTQVDTIRTDFRYMQAAIELGLPLSVEIDPINPHTWDHEPGSVSDHARDHRIWFPDLAAPVPPSYLAAYPRLRAQYTVRCMPGTEIGWGEQWAAPLERYFHDRSGRDSTTLDTEYLAPIDAARGVLAAWIQSQVRSQLGVDQAMLDDLLQRLPRIPALVSPSKASPTFRAQVDLYNQHSRAFLGAIRAIIGTLRTYTSIYDTFTFYFASARWHTERDLARRVVIRHVGNGKEFMVLSSYVLQKIPAWAQDAMRVSVAMTVEDEITSLNMLSVTRDLMNSGATPGDAAAIADQLIRPVAAEAAQAIANEWMNRPWPYEFVPPPTPVPPSQGIPEKDRKTYFTVVAAARQTSATAPRLLLPSVFAPDKTTLVAYAQGEAHNWLEFNATYGGGETFDQIVRTPWGAARFARYGIFIANPRHWRVATVAGWNWRSRLTLSDTLPEALELNPVLAEYLRDAGITNVDKPALTTLNLH